MYFASRMQAGRMLAAQLVEKYRYENCAIIALNDGGVIVGLQIAMQLHCSIALMESAEIFLPLEPVALAGITATGEFSYNTQYTPGEIEDLSGESRGFVEQEKLRLMHDVNRLIGSSGTIDKRLLSGRNIIIVSDGLKTSFEIDLAYEFLKPVKLEKVIFAVPFASVKAIDKMHVLGDDLYCLNVLEDYISTDHYYDKNDVPSHIKVIKTIEQIVLKWKQ